MTVYGMASGQASQVAFRDFSGASPGGRLQGFWVYRTGEETFGEDLAALAALVADGRLVPRLGVVRDWSETRAALAALRARQVTGKVVLTRS
jgi:NADPH:quinone reductase-like Zn-dependent oxidoreductase